MGWLARLWRRSTVADRLIFHYLDGERKRSADPVEIERRLARHLGNDWRAALKRNAAPIPPELIGNEAKDAREAKDKLRETILTAINDAFGVKPYRDGEGLTEPQRFGLLQAFQLYIIDLADYASPFVSVQARASPSKESQPIRSGADSISHATQ